METSALFLFTEVGSLAHDWHLQINTIVAGYTLMTVCESVCVCIPLCSRSVSVSYFDYLTGRLLKASLSVIYERKKCHGLHEERKHTSAYPQLIVVCCFFQHTHGPHFINTVYHVDDSLRVACCMSDELNMCFTCACLHACTCPRVCLSDSSKLEEDLFSVTCMDTQVQYLATTRKVGGKQLNRDTGITLFLQK